MSATEWTELEKLGDDSFEDVEDTRTTYYRLIYYEWRYMKGEIPGLILDYTFARVKKLMFTMRYFSDVEDHDDAYIDVLGSITSVQTTFEMWDIALRWVCHGKTMQDWEYHRKHFADFKATTHSTIVKWVDVFKAVCERAKTQNQLRKRIPYQNIILRMYDLCYYLGKAPNMVVGTEGGAGDKRNKTGVDIFM